MPYLEETKERCRDLRRSGHTLKSIVELTRVPMSTLYQWVKHEGPTQTRQPGKAAERQDAPSTAADGTEHLAGSET